MGGDGTFREVAADLYASARREEIAMGMLPTGTANDQGKSFGLVAAPEALARNVEVVCEGRDGRGRPCTQRSGARLTVHPGRGSHHRHGGLEA